MYKPYAEWSSAYAKNIIETNKSLQDRVFKLVS